LEELSTQVDGILVIGGKNSANTTRLFRMAESLCSGRAWHIEDERDIPAAAYDLGRIGLTAGASTPDEVIDAVEQALQNG
ncbi:MAG TPA: 4-hydroxy-3-methylbut-2-enyl diphosphate reductase, partial [Treponemataceae bacterium]|nr:4-hydroxy-3-methylbut-2-enyl diphosphate reductase [Treponemataceae bacterium]